MISPEEVKWRLFHWAEPVAVLLHVWDNEGDLEVVLCQADRSSDLHHSPQVYFITTFLLLIKLTEQAEL